MSGYTDVRRLCAALVDEQSADDLAQETLLRATRAMGDFRGDASGRTWLLAIARRTCMDELRGRYRRDRRDRLIAATSGPSDAAPDRTRDVEIYDLLARLEPDRRTAFVLTQLFRLPYDEAATVCDCPLGTIRSRVARARDDLIGLITGEHVPRRATSG